MRFKQLEALLLETKEKENFTFNQPSVQRLIDERLNDLTQLKGYYGVGAYETTDGFQIRLGQLRGVVAGAFNFKVDNGMIYVKGGEGVFKNWKHKPEEGHNIDEILGMVEGQIMMYINQKDMLKK